MWQQVDIKGIIRDSYLFEVELKLLFSSLLGRRNKWCFLGCTDTFCQRWWWYRMSFWIKFWVCRRAILINIFLQVALNLNRIDGIGYNRRRMRSSTSLGSVFMMWTHSRVNHKDHKFSPIGNPLGKVGIDARCRQMKAQAEKDRVGRGYHVQKIFFFFPLHSHFL